MKKKILFTKQLISLMLVFMLALSVAVPALAAEGSTGYSITINNKENLPDMVEGQFTAYQVFKGVLNAKEPDNRQLADISWGNGVNSADLVSALKEDATLKAQFEGVRDVNDNDQAAEVSDVLVKNKDDSFFLQDFAKLVSSNLKSGTGVVSELDSSKNSVINVSDAGYYLVVENEDKIPGVGSDGQGTGNANKVTSSFILDVLGNQKVNIKADIPDVTKDIVVNSKAVKGNTFNINDTVNFRLTGLLPDNFDSYKTYSYKFTDTIGKGLTLVYNPDKEDTKASLKASVKNGETETELPAEQYTVTVNKNESGETELGVEFSNLHNLFDKNGEKVTVNSSSNIIINYTAVVNENAVSGVSGNPNKVYLEYSNNPNNSSKGQTTEKIVYVYEFGLELTKLASDTNEPLNGAEFVLSKTEGEKTYYAQFNDASKVGDNRKLKGWVETLDQATNLATDTDGKINVEGIEEGTYTLTESKTPTGYNTMKSVTFTITANIDENGVLKELSAVLDGERTDVKITSDGIISTGIVPITLVNQRASNLPFTGGMGVVAIYILGGVLLAGACVYLIATGRKKKAE